MRGEHTGDVGSKTYKIIQANIEDIHFPKFLPIFIDTPFPAPGRDV